MPISSDQNSPVPTVMGVSPGTPTSISSCMTSIRSTLQCKGFLSDVALRIAAAHRLSTQSVCDSKWRLLCDWSAEQGRDPFSATASQLADFITFLFKDKRFAPSAIAGYRTTAINMVEKVTGTHPADNHLLSSLLSQFKVKRPHPCNIVPGWDLAVVLHALHSAPDESLAHPPPPVGPDLQSCAPLCLGFSQTLLRTSHFLPQSSVSGGLVQCYPFTQPTLRG